MYGEFPDTKGVFTGPLGENGSGSLNLDTGPTTYKGFYRGPEFGSPHYEGIWKSHKSEKSTKVTYNNGD